MENETYSIGKNKRAQRQKSKNATSKVKGILPLDEAGKRRIRNPKRPKEINSNLKSSNGFLNTVFLPKLVVNTFEDNKEILNLNPKKVEVEFYNSLKQIEKYYHLKLADYSGFEFPYNMSLSFSNLKRELKKSVECWEDLRFVKKGKKFYLSITEEYDTGMNLFFIPVIPLYFMFHDKRRRKTALLILSVFSYLYRHAGVPYFRHEDSYLYSNYEMLKEWFEQDEEIDEDHSSKKELSEAMLIGDMMEQKISNAQNLHFFKSRLESFKPEDSFDEECFQIAEQVFNLYTNFPNESVFRNAHFNNRMSEEFFDEDDYDETVISMEKYISFYAHDKGLVSQNLVDMINNEFNEYAELQEPMIVKSFDGSKVKNDFLEFESRMFTILNQLAVVLNEYSK